MVVTTQLCTSLICSAMMITRIEIKLKAALVSNLAKLLMRGTKLKWLSCNHTVKQWSQVVITPLQYHFKT